MPSRSASASASIASATASVAAAGMPNAGRRHGAVASDSSCPARRCGGGGCGGGRWRLAGG
eukprot:1180148-Heterocapsa_arctica.AAC.1